LEVVVRLDVEDPVVPRRAADHRPVEDVQALLAAAQEADVEVTLRRPVLAGP
jgi:hypothetical protein